MSARLHKNLGTIALVVTLALLLTAPLRAALLLPNQTAFAVAVTAPSGTSQAGPLSQTFSGGAGPTAFSGTLVSQVLQENLANNPLGGLTFTFKVSNDPTSLSAISRLTTDDFTGFQTDVGYVTPGVPPTSNDRNGAAVVGWSFTSVGNGAQGFINANQSSALLVIRTDAPSFKSITANLLAGGPATAASFGPAPEPAALALLAMGGLLIKRRRA
jgi:hypothetical protein